jgi:hypothetical protein
MGPGRLLKRHSLTREIFEFIRTRISGQHAATTAKAFTSAKQTNGSSRAPFLSVCPNKARLVVASDWVGGSTIITERRLNKDAADASRMF